jgi:hypothetical protein
VGEQINKVGAQEETKGIREGETERYKAKDGGRRNKKGTRKEGRNGKGGREGGTRCMKRDA